ncbi:MAG TPA: ATP-binding protein, partial [Noviherbaspirillum sp.]|uniref:hybrid sensor histidine kinase/response regulator n=1 Tax=Noviherbaspirillum sp. TaxID=1926288 RepID=UPI002DDDAB9A
GSSPETRQRAQQIIARQTGHLNTLVDELLDAHRILNGKIALSRVRIDLGATVRQCVDAFEARGATASHKVSAHIESVMIDADPTRLEQMVTNLLDNAVKYTPEGGAITLAVRRENDDAVFTVTDTGIGMSAELLDHAFEVFVQGPVSSRMKGGLGVGLAVVNALAVQHGATLKAESEGTGRGSTFTIRFPVASGVPMAPETKPGQRINANVSVLVIEDNDDVREMMCGMLSVLGYRVTSADTGQSGLRRAAEERPDVMLVDIDLPDMSGYDIAKRLKSSALTAHIRLIANTGYSQLADKREAMESGFDAHLKKPISLDQLVATIENQ